MGLFLLSLGVALALARAAKGVACPPEEIIRPCTCRGEEVICSRFSDMRSLQDVFENSLDHPFGIFKLQDSNVMYLHASWVTEKKMFHITIANSSLTALFDGTPSNDNEMSFLYLYNVRLLRGVEWRHFRPFEKLIYLEMHDVEIRKFGESFTQNVSPSTRVIRFRRTKTNQLSDDAFRRFTDVYNFELSHAQVTTVKRSMFPNPSRIEWFNMSYNRIESLPADMFSNMYRITVINLNGNKLVTLPAEIYKDIYEVLLSDLDVKDNPIVCNCSISWLVRSPARVRVDGSCVAPVNLKNKPLLQLKPEDFNYCPKNNAIPLE